MPSVLGRAEYEANKLDKGNRVVVGGNAYSQMNQFKPWIDHDEEFPGVLTFECWTKRRCMHTIRPHYEQRANHSELHRRR